MGQLANWGSLKNPLGCHHLRWGASVSKALGFGDCRTNHFYAAVLPETALHIPTSCRCSVLVYFFFSHQQHLISVLILFFTSKNLFDASLSLAKHHEHVLEYLLNRESLCFPPRNSFVPGIAFWEELRCG